MSIQVLSFDHLLALLKESIEIGKKHYLVLVIGAAIITACNQILALTPMGSLLNPILALMWTVGVIFVSQTIIEKKAPPQVEQYFVAFSKISLLKALLPTFIVILIVSIVSVVALGIFSYLLILIAGASVAATQLSLIIFALISAAIMLPVTFLPYLTVLQPQHWKEALKSSVDALLKNKVLIAFYIIPPVALSLFSSVGSYIATFIVLFVTPLITSFNYLVYKRLFTYDKPDLDIASVKH